MTEMPLTPFKVVENELTAKTSTVARSRCVVLLYGILVLEISAADLAKVFSTSGEVIARNQTHIHCEMAGKVSATILGSTQKVRTSEISHRMLLKQAGIASDEGLVLSVHSRKGGDNST